MRRDQLEHAIRTACQISGLTEVIIVGSQAIFGTYIEEQLPFYATRSAEIDVLPTADHAGEIRRLAGEIEGIAASFSPFAHLHGFSIDGVDLQTSALPDGWLDIHRSSCPGTIRFTAGHPTGRLCWRFGP